SEMMGGHIGVHSEENNGSSFWFDIILENQKNVRQTMKPDYKNITKDTRIIVVDDNLTNIEILKTYLAEFQIKFATNAKDALNIIKDAQQRDELFDLALIDLCMPDIDGSELGKFIKDDNKLKTMKLVMMTSLVNKGDANKFQNMGFDGYLNKPIRQEVLINTLSLVLGKPDKEEGNLQEYHNEIITQHSVKEFAKKTVKILIVEDNFMNQELAKAMIETQGYFADTANDGVDALEVLKKTEYDIVFMDCHMPNMDGFKTTAMIREPKTKCLNPNIPIVAMTANALKGDREKCLDAGMDDYISKPINIKDIEQVFKKFIIKK
ncbi:MAG: response regulator, partial [Alphaproteobacteria bacterium]